MNQTIRRGDLMAPNGTVRAGEGVVLDFQETSFRPKWGRARAKAPGDLGGIIERMGLGLLLLCLVGCHMRKCVRRMWRGLRRRGMFMLVSCFYGRFWVL
ncbi:hypothetical protein BCR33DRAFT_724161, partial [Rhizoclosmatium globosum]